MRIKSFGGGYTRPVIERVRLADGTIEVWEDSVLIEEIPPPVAVFRAPSSLPPTIETPAPKGQLLFPWKS